ncbi:MAG: hypothetical protein Q4D98_08195 [Planctomycetia bacterium]|nr:hypothetical protein [Planctomycetia bacterium]
MKQWGWMIFLLGSTGLVWGQGAVRPLPAGYGQVWKDYDISRYVDRLPVSSRAEASVMDWILMETGFEVWHSVAPSMLYSSPKTIHVYHTPAVQQRVEALLARFTNNDPWNHQFRVQVFTVPSPLWRQESLCRMQPIPSTAPGSQAWVIRPEEMAAVTRTFQETKDFTMHTAEVRTVPNGQALVLNFVRRRSYTRNYYTRPGKGGPEADDVALDEGFSLEFMPLLTLDRGLVDAQIKFQINHVDRFFPMTIEANGPKKIEIPMLGQYRFRDRYRWNPENALLVSFGLTPYPVATGGETLPPLRVFNPTQRVETFVLIEYRHKGDF